MDWTLITVAVITGLLTIAASSVTLVVKNWIEKRDDVKRQVIRLYCEECLDPLASAGYQLYSKIRLYGSAFYRDLLGELIDHYQIALDGIAGLSKLSLLPGKFDEIPRIYNSMLITLLELHGLFGKEISKSSKSGLKGFELYIVIVELEEATKCLNEILAKAALRITQFNIHEAKNILETVKQDEELVELGGKVEEIEDTISTADSKLREFIKGKEAVEE